MVDDLGRDRAKEHGRQRAVTAAADHDQLGAELGSSLHDQRGRATVEDGPFDGQRRPFERGDGGVEDRFEVVAGLQVEGPHRWCRDDQGRQQLGGRFGDGDDLDDAAARPGQRPDELAGGIGRR